MAMQSGVPIVPVVIHNSHDISPKGDRIFRSGTVHVDVLPPIDTSDWTTETLQTHVTDVRNTFLRALAQPELSVEETLALEDHTPDDLKPEVRGQTNRQRRTKRQTSATIIPSKHSKRASLKTTSQLGSKTVMPPRRRDTECHRRRGCKHSLNEALGPLPTRLLFFSSIHRAVTNSSYSHDGLPQTRHHHDQRLFYV